MFVRLAVATTMAAALVTSCASIQENQRLNQLAQTAEVNGRRWDFARDGDYLHVRPAGVQAYVNDLRFKREATAAAEAYSGCRFVDPVWDEEIVSVWLGMGRLVCPAG